MNEIQLKPCPFCGSEVTFNYNGELVPDGIKCMKCGYLIRYMRVKKYKIFADLMKQMAERWNKRETEQKG